nr:MAG TPA: hypothetical protein [Caudoviricetes sp.]
MGDVWIVVALLETENPLQSRGCSFEMHWHGLV